MPKPRPSNRRIFPRYKMDRGFVCEVDGKKFNARLKDLSITGLGLVIDGYLQKPDSDNLDIRIAEIGLETTGRTVWREKRARASGLGCSGRARFGGTCAVYVSQMFFWD